MRKRERGAEGAGGGGQGGILRAVYVAVVVQVGGHKQTLFLRGFACRQQALDVGEASVQIIGREGFRRGELSVD